MQYKQAVRILAEIAFNEDAGTKLRFRAAKLLIHAERLPRLGPYRKRSPKQVAWRFACDSRKDPIERWVALRALLGVERPKRRSETTPAGSLCVGGVSSGSRTRTAHRDAVSPQPELGANL